MSDVVATPPARRADRRRARTRAALIDAAKQLIVEGAAATATIQQITETADVGFGSFYNHFASKDELFHAATAAVLEEWAQLIEDAARHLSDPAERFAVSFRISARLAWTHPALAEVLDRFGLDLLDLSDVRDIAEGVQSGRFTVTNVPVALSVVGGSLLGFLRVRTSQPDLVSVDDVEALTHQLLVMLGVEPDEATRLCRASLPGLESPETA